MHFSVDIGDEAMRPSNEANRVLIELPDAPTEIIGSVQDAVNMAMRLLNGEMLADADRLAQIIAGVARPSSDLVRERMARLKTINTLAKETQWLTASSIQAAVKGKHSRAVAADWRRRGRIFGIIGGDGKYLFPAYQFDRTLHPLPVIQSILKAFGPVDDLWILVAWFHFPNGWLVSRHDPERCPRAPKNCLEAAAAVVRAAGQRGNTYFS